MVMENKYSRLYGIGEPLALRGLVGTLSSKRLLGLSGHIDPLKSLDLMAAMGFTALREWMIISAILDAPDKVNAEAYKMCTEILNKCVALDIEVTGMNNVWFLPDGFCDKFGTVSPERDLNKDSKYTEMLDMLELSWYTMVSYFPQIKLWEVGNEWNQDGFLYPTADLREKGKATFTNEEKALISLDMMYRSAKGIRRANPDAEVVSYSPCMLLDLTKRETPHYLNANYEIALTYERLYQYIEEGKSFSKKADDYFDIVSFHPYIIPDGEPDDIWVDSCEAVRRVMEKHGDRHKEIMITEFGFTDGMDDELAAVQAERYAKIFDYCKKINNLRTIHIFRFYEDYGMLMRDEEDGIGGKNEVKFGLFTEPEHGHVPRQKAIEIQRYTGGKGDLYMHRSQI